MSNNEKKIEVDIDPLNYLFNQGWRPAKRVVHSGTNNCPFCSSGRKKAHQSAVCAKITLGDYWARVTCYHEDISYLVYKRGEKVDEQQKRKQPIPERVRPAEQSRLGRSQTADERPERPGRGQENGDHGGSRRPRPGAYEVAPRRPRY